MAHSASDPARRTAVLRRAVAWSSTGRNASSGVIRLARRAGNSADSTAMATPTAARTRI
jgi:hypothetical protein